MKKVIFEPVLEGCIGVCPKEKMRTKFYSQRAMGLPSNRKWSSEVRKSSKPLLPPSFRCVPIIVLGLEWFWFGKLVIIPVPIIQFYSHCET